MWGIGRFGALQRALVFGVATAVLLGCWGVLKFAPGAAEPGSAQPTAETGMTFLTGVQLDLPNETPAEARKRQHDVEVRMKRLVPISVAIGNMAGLRWRSEEQRMQLAAQTIELCHDQ